MKADLNSQLKPNLIKKPSKPLNEKKNSIVVDNTLKKQRSKPNITLNDTQTSSSTIQKLASPKNLTGLLSAISPKTEGNEELFKSQKSDLKKTGITTKPKKTLLSKHEPIKKQFLPSLRSPKGAKNTSIKSQLVIGSQKQKSTLFNEQSHLNIELDTSIARIDQVQDSIMSQEIHISQTSRKQIPTLQESKIEELSKTSKEQSQEILRLKQKNDELQRKLNKIKASQDQNRKRLKSRISTFNEEKEELLQYKEKISELQNLVVKLQSQNKELTNSTTSHLKISQKIVQVKECEQCSNRRQYFLSQSNKTIQIQILPQKSITKSENIKNQMVDESVMTSFEDSICDGVLSFINGNSSCKLQESILSNQKAKQSFTESENVIPPFQVEFIKNSYEEKYKYKISMIESFYKESLKDIESRFKLLLRQTSDIIKSQQGQLMSLENKIDDLYQKLEQCVCQSKGKSTNFPSIETDEEKLKYLMQINQFKQKLSKKDESIKQCREQIHNKQIQCKKVAAELDIERIKYNLNFESGNLQKQIIELAQNEQYDILKEQLKQQKEKNLKLSAQNSKKQELIKKLSAYHSSNTAITKKVIRK